VICTAKLENFTASRKMRTYLRFLPIYSLHVLLAAPVEEFDLRVEGVFLVSVAVKDSLAAVETLILDTGSRHTWIYHNDELKRIHRKQKMPEDALGGFRTNRVGKSSKADAREIHYADSNMIICDRWTRKEFAIGSHKWGQKFGIARGNEKERAPLYSGLIGASPGSHFATLHPQFGFRPVDSHAMKLFFGPIDPAQCEGGKVGYMPLSDDHHWTTRGSIDFGGHVSLPHVNMAVDTGASVFAFPRRLFNIFQAGVKSLGIRYQYLPDKLSGLVDCRDVSRLPPFEISTSNGSKITIPYQLYVKKVGGTICILLVASIADSLPVVLGRPVTVNFLTQFDSANRRIGICKPVGSKFDGQIIEDVPMRGPVPPEITQPRRVPDEVEEGPFDVLSSSSLSFNFALMVVVSIISCI